MAVVPAVVALFFLVIQVSLWFYGRQVATAAAEHGLDAARVYRSAGAGADTGAGAATIDAFFAQIGGVESHSTDISQGGGVVTVHITAQPVTVLPFFSQSIDVTLEAPIEEPRE